MKRKLSRAYTTAGSYKKRRASVAQTASAALTLARRVARSVETKAVSVNASGTISSSAPTVTHVTAIAQGDDTTNRSGDFISLTRFRFRGVLTNNGASAFQPLVRILVVQNLRQQQDTDADMGRQYNAESIYGMNLASVGFKNLMVHYDKVHQAPMVSQSASTPTFQVGRRFIEFDLYFKKSIKVAYNGTTAADIDGNGLYVIMVSDLSSNMPSVTWYGLAEYTDA